MFWVILAIYMFTGYICGCAERLVHSQSEVYRKPFSNTVNWILWLLLWPVLLFIGVLIRLFRNV